MKKRLLSRRPSPAMIIAIVALVAALGGTAVAAGGFLTTKKFNKFKGQVVRGPVQYVSNSATVPDASLTPVQVTATCPSGTKLLGGGGTTSVSDTGAYFDTSAPLGSTAWQAGFDNNTGSPYTATVTAICATSR